MTNGKLTILLVVMMSASATVAILFSPQARMIRSKLASAPLTRVVDSKPSLIPNPWLDGIDEIGVLANRPNAESSTEATLVEQQDASSDDDDVLSPKPGEEIVAILPETAQASETDEKPVIVAPLREPNPGVDSTRVDYGKLSEDIRTMTDALSRFNDKLRLALNKNKRALKLTSSQDRVSIVDEALPPRTDDSKTPRIESRPEPGDGE